MSPVNFTISHSQAVADEFQRLFEVARSQNRLPLAVRAGRFLWDELGYDPTAFGESREYYAAADLRVRIAFARPWCVEFAVHFPSRTVFLRRFALLR